MYFFTYTFNRYNSQSMIYNYLRKKHSISVLNAIYIHFLEARKKYYIDKL